MQPAECSVDIDHCPYPTLCRRRRACRPDNRRHLARRMGDDAMRTSTTTGKISRRSRYRSSTYALPLKPSVPRLLHLSVADAHPSRGICLDEREIDLVYAVRIARSVVNMSAKRAAGECFDSENAQQLSIVVIRNRRYGKIVGKTNPDIDSVLRLMCPDAMKCGNTAGYPTI